MDRMEIDEAEAEEPAPSYLNAASQGQGLDVDKDRLRVRYIGDVRYANPVGAIQANAPAPSRRMVYYYEVTVLDQGESGKIGIGFAPATFKMSRQPGWEPNSYGYHGDDGRKYANNTKGEEYGPTFGSGDTIGAGINWRTQEMFFTKNGTKLKVAFKFKQPGLLLPTIGLHSKNESIWVNFGQKPFKFDLEGMLEDERTAQQAAIDKVSMPASTTHALVRKYLLHYGYASSLKAFDRAAGPAAFTGCVGCGVSSSAGSSSAGGGGGHGGGGSGGGSSANGDASSFPSISSACRDDDDEFSGLSVRHELRQSICAGDMDAALETLQHCYPELLEEGSGHEEVQFHVHSQKYIELVRSGKIEAAVAYAQTMLARLRVVGGGSLDGALRDVVAIIAYERPEESPLKRLLSAKQREMVADAVNSAVLATLEGRGGTPRPQSEIEQLLRQLASVHAALHEVNGGAGEPFRLRDNLLPPPPPSALPVTTDGGGAQPMDSMV